MAHSRRLQVKHSFAEAVKVSTLQPPPHAVQPPCPHHGTCGGCTLQALAYAAQLRAKEGRLRYELQRRARLNAEHIDSIVQGVHPCAQELRCEDVPRRVSAVSCQ
jgi:23S rRNA (uracil1939-C5)-methyltransferase